MAATPTKRSVIDIPVLGSTGNFAGSEQSDVALDLCSVIDIIDNNTSTSSANQQQPTTVRPLFVNDNSILCVSCTDALSALLRLRP